MIKVGKTYVGQPKSGRRHVTAIEEEKVHYLLPISLQQCECSVEEFEAWSIGEHEPPIYGHLGPPE